MDIIAKGGIKLEADRFDKFYSTTCAILKSIQKLKSKYMVHYGLSSAHTMCLRHLYKSPEGLTRTKLANLCDIDKAQISRIVNELCSKGYITEPESENVNYRKRLKLTPLGRTDPLFCQRRYPRGRDLFLLCNSRPHLRKAQAGRGHNLVFYY